MKTKILLLCIISLIQFYSNSFAQDYKKPKLVVGIVVDQMRYDYLYKFYSNYGEAGFKRLMNEGSNFTFAHLNYVPTYTAPGHASIYTGTTPYYHGIISNYWYDRKIKKSISSCDDSDEKTVGANDDEGERSPKKLITSTITDQLKLATNGAAKVIGISIKDRAAILPAGHNADAAYWFDSKNGKFISSTFYIKKLPAWVNEFNSQNLPEKYMSSSWTLSKPIGDYSVSLPDESKFEYDVFDEGKTSFPHNFNNIKSSEKFEKFESTPYGNEIILEFAKAVLKNENLGKGNQIDFLAISFSSTDHIGHGYGPNSVEVQDTYIKLDKQLSELLKTLDKQVGKGNYLLFLTADHGVVENNGYRDERNLNPIGINSKKFSDSLKTFSKRFFNGDNLIANISNNQIFFDYALIENSNLNLNSVEITFKNYIRNTFPEITEIFIRSELDKFTPQRITTNLILNGFNPIRSGDIAYGFRAGFLSDKITKGSSHSSYYSYDTHVPLLFYGWHIPAETINTPVTIVDIAPTVADLLKITEPDGCIGIPLIK